MSVAYTPYLITVDDFEAMGRAGVLGEDARVELLEGQLYAMSPIGSRHAACVNRLNQALTVQVQNRAIVSVQNPIRLDDYSEPEPDIALLRPREDFYASAHPGPQDVLLVIEVADTSVAGDRRIKLPLYARSGIPEVWLVVLEAGEVEVYRQPGSEGYGRVERLSGEQALSPEVFSDVALRVGDLFG